MKLGTTADRIAASMLFAIRRGAKAPDPHMIGGCCYMARPDLCHTDLDKLSKMVAARLERAGVTVTA